MKQNFYTLSAFVIFQTCFLAGFGQDNPLNRKISLAFFDRPLEEALLEVSDKGGFVFSYNPEIVPTDSLVSYDGRSVMVRDILKQFFGNRMQFRQVGNHLIIHPRKSSVKGSSGNVEPQPQEPAWYLLSGYLIDNHSGEKVRFATVFENAGRTSTLTDQLGRYEIKVEGDVPQVALAFSKRGYLDTVVVVRPARANKVTVGMRPIPGFDDSLSLRSVSLVGDQDVEQFHLVDFMVPETQQEQALNLEGPLRARPFQVSLIPPLGTNKILSGGMVNYFSFNLLGGYAHGLKGVELGGIVNINRGNVRGVEIGGIANVVGGKVTGLQAAGTFNRSYRFSGLQFSGVLNIADSLIGTQVAGVVNIGDAVSGLQTAGVVNIGDTVTGLQVGGVANIGKAVRGGQVSGLVNTGHAVRGTQIGGLVNVGHHIRGTQIAGLLNTGDRVSGLQIAGFINHAGDHTGGAQFAGFLNRSKGNAGGTQIAGFLNSAKGTVGGSQLAGFLNHAGEKVKGFQISGFVNRNAGSTDGFQLAGFANSARGSVKGFQIAGFANQIADSIDGLQAAGFVNYARGAVQGYQVAGFANVARETVKGFQMAGFWNHAAGGVRWLQIGGFGNVARKELHGLQLAGFTNVLLADARGSQVSGFLNVARKVDGFQIGLINIADSVGKFSLGLININKSGYNAFELSANEVLPGNLIWKSGRSELYSMIAAGMGAGPDGGLQWGYGFGLGSRWRLGSRLSLALDVLSYQVIEPEIGHGALNMIIPGRLSLGFQLNDFLEVFAGGGATLHISDAVDEMTGEFASQLGNTPFWTADHSNYLVQSWLGYSGGLRIHLIRDKRNGKEKRNDQD